MKAKDMFELLGYKQFIEDAITIQYLRDDKHQIRFWKSGKQIELFGGYELEIDLENNQYFTDNFELFIAINKQIEELGWNNE